MPCNMQSCRCFPLTVFDFDIEKKDVDPLDASKISLWPTISILWQRTDYT